MSDEKPFANVRVLDLTRLYAGPFCTMLMADLGADVVKLEAPEGDPIRRQGPPFHNGQGLSFLAVNRNKRSIALDLKSEQGRRDAVALATVADVVVENFRPAVMARLGLDYESLSAANPRLIYASISGLGATGPLSSKGAFDLTAQALGGYMSITGERDGAPVKLGTSAFDLVAGMYLMGGIGAALYQRERTGRGQRIETSLLEGQVSFLVEAGLEQLIAGTVRGKWGSEHANLVPYKAFETADGWIVIGAGIQRLFETLATELGQAHLIENPRFASEQLRVENRDALYALLDPVIRELETGPLEKRLDAAGVPCAPVNTTDKVFANEQVLHRGMVRQVSHPGYGGISLIGPAVKYSGFDVAADWTAPPLLAEHTEDVKRDWLG